MHIRLPVKFFLNILLLIAFGSTLQAQKKYNKVDSIEIFRLLNEADEADMHGQMDLAFTLVNRAIEKSRQNSFLTGQAFGLLKLADLKLKTDGATGLDKYYQEAKKLAKIVNNNFLNGLIDLQYAQQKNQAAEFEEAEKYCQDALKYFILSDSIHYVAYTYNELGFIYEKMGKYENAAQNNLKAISGFEKVGDLKEAANTIGNLAIVYYRLGKKNDALEMFKESAAIREEIRDIKGLAATYGNIATIYIPIDEDSAEKYYSLQLHYALKSGVKANIAQAYANNVVILDKQKRFSEALEKEKKAIQLYEEIGDKSKLGIRYTSAGNLYHKLNDSLNAEKNFALAESLGNILNNKPVFQNLYLHRSEFYKSRKDYNRALYYLEKYHLYKDSLVNEKTSSNIAELQLKYETEKKDNEIRQLNAATKVQQLELDHHQALLKANQLENQKKEQSILLLKQDQKLKEELLARQSLAVKSNEQQLKISEQEQQLKEQELQREKLIRQIIIGLTTLAIILSAILFGRYRLKRKLEEQKKILAVRDNISRDLHDEIGSTLTSINILSNISRQAFSKDPVQAKDLLQKISEQTKTIQQNMSDIVWALRPENEAIENLEVRMREYSAQTLEANNIKTQFHFDDKLHKLAFSHDVRKDLLLIYKEAVNNIIKHARATQAEITMERDDHKVRMIIKDDGIGSQSNSNPLSGTGTKTMEQRAKDISGHLLIGRNNNGTTVTLEIPLT